MKTLTFMYHCVSIVGTTPIGNNFHFISNSRCGGRILYQSFSVCTIGKELSTQYPTNSLCQWLLNGNFPPNTNDTIFTNGLLGLSASGSIKKERCWRAVYEAIIRVLVYICGYPFQTTRDYVFGHTSVVNRLFYALEHDFCQKIEQNTTEWRRLPMRLREGLFKT